MKGYWITLCHVTDSETYGEYIKLAGPAIQKYGGKFLARGGEQVKYEGSSYDRTVVVEFDSLQSAKDAYNSCLLYTSPSPRDAIPSRMPSSA